VQSQTTLLFERRLKNPHNAYRTVTFYGVAFQRTLALVEKRVRQSKTYNSSKLMSTRFGFDLVLPKENCSWAQSFIPVSLFSLPVGNEFLFAGLSVIDLTLISPTGRTKSAIL
jgi:hypothetical protein